MRLRTAYIAFLIAFLLLWATLLTPLPIWLFICSFIISLVLSFLVRKQTKHLFYVNLAFLALLLFWIFVIPRLFAP